LNADGVSMLTTPAAAQDALTMANKEVSRLPAPSDEELRIATRQAEYANRAAVGGNHDLAIQCLRTSCKLAPANLTYRQTLRKVEKAKYQNNLRGGLFAALRCLPSRAQLWRALKRGDHRKVLEHGEAILARNPWDRGAQLCMARAAVALGLPVLAIWILQQAREKDGNDVSVNRALARLLEKQGHLTQAIAVWELVRKAAPRDLEAQAKAKQLAATDTIVRGNYEEATSQEMPALGTTPTPVPATKKATPVKKQRTGQDEAALRARLTEEPGNAEHYLQLAAWCRRHGNLDEARAALEKGVESAGGAFELTLALADLEIEPLRRDLAGAEEQLRAKPDEAKLQKTRGELLAQINARELDCCRLKAEHDPLDRPNRFELGVRLLQAGQAEEAISEFQEARSEARLRWKALLHLGHCFKARHNWPLALRNYEEALRNLPAGEDAQRKELLFHLAGLHAEAGDLARAIELALDLADLDYAYRDIGRLLEEWQARAQQEGAVNSSGK
jgi:tetratricopeptide (TPR) repeat protein